MNSSKTRPQDNKLAASQGGEKGPPQKLRVLSQDGVARAAAPSIAMPRAKTELSDLLAGDKSLCLRRPAANATRPSADAKIQVESPAAPSTPHIAGEDLTRVIEAWPGLPRNVHAAILAMIRETAAGNA
jgi:hypothetical protein